MTIQSMTGFGKAEATTPEYLARIEIKSVNGRYFEVQFRSSRNLSSLEKRMRDLIEGRLGRGSVTCHIHYEPRDGGGPKVEVDEALLGQLIGVLEKAREKTSLPVSIDLASLVQAPEVLKVTEDSLAATLAGPRILPLLEAAAQDLLESRKTEGRKIEADLHARLATILERFEKVKLRLPERNAGCMERTRQRVKDLIGGNTLDEGRLMTELGILAEKLDVSEEVTRFSAHIILFTDTLAQSDFPGRKLGFILQEMLREVNTLGTKSQDLEIQHLAVSLKEEIEAIREQLQNVA